jgi:hypothetical protein
MNMAKADVSCESEADRHHPAKSAGWPGKRGCGSLPPQTGREPGRLTKASGAKETTTGEFPQAGDIRARTSLSGDGGLVFPVAPHPDGESRA